MTADGPALDAPSARTRDAGTAPRARAASERDARRDDAAEAAPAPALPRRIAWINVAVLALVHAAAALGILHLALGRSSWWTALLAGLWFVLSGLAVTAGYHRLFAHRSYSAHPAVRALYLAFGAAAVQNSALKWCSDHRLHHARTDQDEDPYGITRGFWWAHVLWICYADEGPDPERVKDLAADPLVRLQHRAYVPLAILVGALVPALLGLFWGDWLGALLVAGCLRLAVQWHSTFAINSLAHTIGRRPYSTRTSARDSFWTSLVTFGEGYHNFHHRFQFDYRNGVRRRDFDPSKWLIWTLSRLGLTADLRRAGSTSIERARAAARAERRSEAA